MYLELPSRIGLDTGPLGGPGGVQANPTPQDPNPNHVADLGLPQAGPHPLARAPRRAA